MKKFITYSLSMLIVLTFSAPLLAGKGGGGMGGTGHEPAFNRGQESSMATDRSSERAQQQDRDREQYRGSDAEREKQKAKSKAFGKETGQGDQLRTREQDRVQQQTPAAE